jgi:hypothetical protein
MGHQSPDTTTIYMAWPAVDGAPAHRRLAHQQGELTVTNDELLGAHQE